MSERDFWDGDAREARDDLLSRVELLQRRHEEDLAWQQHIEQDRDSYRAALQRIRTLCSYPTSFPSEQEPPPRFAMNAAEVVRVIDEALGET